MNQPDIRQLQTLLGEYRRQLDVVMRQLRLPADDPIYEVAVHVDGVLQYIAHDHKVNQP